MNQKILVVEDDADINHLICRILRKGGYDVVSAFSGTEALLRLELEAIDLVLLDLMLPGMTGEEIIKSIREEKNQDMPIIVLSAKTSLESKVETLAGGADDYMTKPFEPEELLVRVQASLRRYRPRKGEAEPEILSYKKLCLYPAMRKVTVAKEEILLTPHEYEILYLLMQDPQKVFSRESLYEMVWSGGYYGEDNTVNVHVSNIRKKIAGKDPGAEYIKTVWGIGFKMA